MTMMMKKCATCGKEKPLAEFYTAAGSIDGHSADCKDCALAHFNALRAAAIERGETKRCPACGEIKPINEFDQQQYGTGFTKKCNVCRQAKKPSSDPRLPLDEQAEKLASLSDSDLYHELTRRGYIVKMGRYQEFTPDPEL